ncbi:Coenzyme F420 hydrogenase/dehydrogenase, beta subunit C-terminal domain [Prevotella sp. P2-180]|uniref:Coenzyme F420 hydrogenase/dehydrogenase, beta subunit C-terminal domain n=1 Tax=Prevotella sp. P2-180 TaxID=2024224 RepID=UPI000B960E78|nr:Coenzyme F420 hydrogenase/dehydrogenase, beta subunit C-terminal domain [Prevotella sp. P2-180]OYP65155.1 hypothetical protein CIK98_09075 [Prevotella sp. P2-180]
MKNNNVKFTIQNQMCTGCGICEDVCPKHCITIKRMNGEHRPVLDDVVCNKCGKCLRVCPGVGIEFQQYQVASESVKKDKFIGKYVGLHTGYALDEDIRYHSASGGMVSQFLIYLLEKRVIDGAVVTGYKEDHITPYTYIACSREEIIKARSSKYCPVAFNKVGNKIATLTEGKYVIVGTPCHIQGFRKRMSIDRKLRERIIGLFAIYCSSGRTFNGQDFLFQHYGVKKNDIQYFAFRDHGCMGYLTINAAEKNISIPFNQYYGSMLRSFFKLHRCLTCIDHYGELADVCFGDIHIHPYDKDKIGTSSWITRTDFWEEQFRNAVRDGYIMMDDIDAETMNRGQATMLYPKSRRAHAVMNMDRMLGRAVPQYDRMLAQPSIKDYMSEIICHCQRFLGRHRGLWWIIELISKGK